MKVIITDAKKLLTKRNMKSTEVLTISALCKSADKLAIVIAKTLISLPEATISVQLKHCE